MLRSDGKCCEVREGEGRQRDKWKISLARMQIRWQTIIEMYSSINNKVAEVKRTGRTVPGENGSPSAQGQGTEEACCGVEGYLRNRPAWKEVWRILRDVGYQGTYRQFVAMANRLTGKPAGPGRRPRTSPAPTAERRSQPTATPVANQVAGQNTKPEWQIRREEAMARLDREAEENRAREARLNRPKIFNPTPFKGRGEE